MGSGTRRRVRPGCEQNSYDGARRGRTPGITGHGGFTSDSRIQKPEPAPFALLYNPERDITTQQAKGFAKALKGAGSELAMVPGSVTDPARTNELIGVYDNIAMVALMAFIPSQI